MNKDLWDDRNFFLHGMTKIEAQLTPNGLIRQFFCPIDLLMPLK